MESVSREKHDVQHSKLQRKQHNEHSCLCVHFMFIASLLGKLSFELCNWQFLFIASLLGKLSFERYNWQFMIFFITLLFFLSRLLFFFYPTACTSVRAARSRIDIAKEICQFRDLFIGKPYTRAIMCEYSSCFLRFVVERDATFENCNEGSVET